MKKVLYLLCLFLLIGCGLKRNNPLDPQLHTDILVPSQVSGLIATPSPANVPNKYVKLDWTPSPILNTDGYYIYRSLGYSAAFARVDTVYSAAASTYDHIEVRPGDYYYKVSGFKALSGGRLEGRLSTSVFVRVPN